MSELYFETILLNSSLNRSILERTTKQNCMKCCKCFAENVNSFVSETTPHENNVHNLMKTAIFCCISEHRRSSEN